MSTRALGIYGKHKKIEQIELRQRHHPSNGLRGVEVNDVSKFAAMDGYGCLCIWIYLKIHMKMYKSMTTGFIKAKADIEKCYNATANVLVILQNKGLHRMLFSRHSDVWKVWDVKAMLLSTRWFQVYSSRNDWRFKPTNKHHDLRHAILVLVILLRLIIIASGPLRALQKQVTHINIVRIHYMYASNYAICKPLQAIQYPYIWIIIHIQIYIYKTRRFTVPQSIIYNLCLAQRFQSAVDSDQTTTPQFLPSAATVNSCKGHLFKWIPWFSNLPNINYSWTKPETTQKQISLKGLVQWSKMSYYIIARILFRKFCFKKKHVQQELFVGAMFKVNICIICSLASLNSSINNKKYKSVQSSLKNWTSPISKSLLVYFENMSWMYFQAGLCHHFAHRSTHGQSICSPHSRSSPFFLRRFSTTPTSTTIRHVLWPFSGGGGVKQGVAGWKKQETCRNHMYVQVP